MSEPILKNQIISWLKTQPYWFQFVGNQILEGAELNDTLVNQTYLYFKEENRLQEAKSIQVPITFNEISVPQVDISSNLRLVAIKNIENVNALQPGQSIEINKNLTIVYGNNGSGKSGYVRLLNNAFINSRGDKNILTNVFSNAHFGNAKCDFVFQATGEPYEKTFPIDKNSFEFLQFVVFDSQSVKVHLDNNNLLNFIPRGFDFFELVVQLFEELKNKLNNEILNARPQNNFIIHFQNENEIRDFIKYLDAPSNLEVLKRLSDFTEADASRLEEITVKISELKALNIQAQITEFEKLQRELTEFMLKQQLILNVLTKEKIEYYLGLIDSFHAWQKISNAEGVKSMENYSIDLIGSSSWRDFIIESKKYANNIEQKRGVNILYPSEKDRCLFCLQPLHTNEISLINLYWQFIKSQAETEIKNTYQLIQNALHEIKGLNSVKFDETTNLFVFLNHLKPDLTSKWKKLVVDIEEVKSNLIKNLENLDKSILIHTFTDNTSEFKDIVAHLTNQIDTLFAKKPDQEIVKLTFEFNYLTDKSLLAKLSPQVSAFIRSYKWALAAEYSLSAFRTNSLTTFQGGLFTQHITNRYTQVFNTECQSLNGPTFVEIVQQNNKLRTFRRLSVANRTASQILSEGEQRVISLADFLTEVELNPFNRGVIFDDPVNSLDHQRRALIAQRLVKLAEEKQVLIFTHDLLFVNFLKNLSTPSKIEFQCHWIEKLSDLTGVISNNNSPATEGDYKTINLALKAWEESRTATPENREKILWKGFSSLRTNYEYLIIFDLFQQVVERFEERVSVERLKEVVVLPELTNKIITKVGILSRYIDAHLHSDTFVSTKPTSDDLKREIDEFQLVKNKVKEIRQTIIKASVKV